MRRVGILHSWGPKGYGVVRIGPRGSFCADIFYIIATSEVEPAEPVVGMSVEFEIAEHLIVPEGRFPVCLRVDVIIPATDAASSVLAGESAVQEAK